MVQLRLSPPDAVGRIHVAEHIRLQYSAMELPLTLSFNLTAELRHKRRKRVGFVDALQNLLRRTSSGTVVELKRTAQSQPEMNSYRLTPRPTSKGMKLNALGEGQIDEEEDTADEMTSTTNSRANHSMPEIWGDRLGPQRGVTLKRLSAPS